MLSLSGMHYRRVRIPIRSRQSSSEAGQVPCAAGVPAFSTGAERGKIRFLYYYNLLIRKYYETNLLSSFVSKDKQLCQ